VRVFGSVWPEAIVAAELALALIRGARPSRRPARSAPAARPWPRSGSRGDSKIGAGRSRSLSSRAKAAPPPSSTTTSRSPRGRTKARRPAWPHAPAADELLATARESGQPQDYALAFTAAARLLLAQGDRQQANALLVELDQVGGARADSYYAAALAELVRTTLALRQPELATRLVHGVESRTPLFEHALSSSRAQLAEVAGEHAEAAPLYAEAAERWRKFGNVPERAYALLGQGRCLNAQAKMEAEAPLREASELFASMGYKPALAETYALLGSADAAAL